MENNTSTNPHSRRLALNGLGSHPAWQVYCERFDEIVRKEIEANIFDLATSCEDRRTFVAARKLLVDGFAPERMRVSMLSAAENEIVRAERERDHPTK